MAPSPAAPYPMKYSRLLTFTFILTFTRLAAPAAELHLAQGILAGEVTATSAILQTRLTARPGLDATGDVPGTPGFVRFELSTSEAFTNPRRTDWLPAQAASDHIVKAVIPDLKPATRYHYRVLYSNTADDARPHSSPRGSFQTLPAPTSAAPVNFVLTSCLNYAFFRDGTKGQGGGAQGRDRELGYPALEPMLKLEPDFCILDGDCVYYDHHVATRAETLPQLRKKWHEQYVMPRFVKLFARVPTYWLKDDHDHRKNDSDATGDYAPSHELGIATFREQVPVVNPADPKAVTYRTHRMGRDLQLWFVEGRDYRTPNRAPDGPDKTIWGAEQRAWLQRTLKESDATFKILISPTPIIGPDDGSKRDNHVNPAGFKHEGESFLAWLKDNGVQPGQFYILTGDRHWKYHSRHATGFEEFACGALNRENSRLGRAPGDPKSTDPKALVQQLYTDNPASGGFLHVSVTPGRPTQRPQIQFRHHDDTGKVLYTHTADPHLNVQR